MQQKFGLEEFVISEDRWGFGGTFTHYVLNNNARQFTLPIPTIMLGEKQYNFKAGLSACASLLVLLCFLDFQTAKQSPALLETEQDERAQLLVIDCLLVERQVHGGSIQVSLSQKLCSWIMQFESECVLKPAVNAMKKAHRIMWPAAEHAQSEINVSIRAPKWLFIEAPGDSCDLAPREWRESDYSNRGYKLDPHNMDSQIQTLIMLVGLAAVCDMARKDGF